MLASLNSFSSATQMILYFVDYFVRGRDLWMARFYGAASPSVASEIRDLVSVRPSFQRHCRVIKAVCIFPFIGRL